jgi:hypothetical protein
MTNKIMLRSVEEFMQGYNPVYLPLYRFFLGNAQAYPQVVGQLDFRRADTVGDIRLKRLLPKDTNIHQIAVSSGTKSFKKYFNAAQYVQSEFQDLDGNEDVIKQVLDENQRLQDELFLLGEGTDASTMLNNGLYWSDDANYTLESAISAIAAASTGYHLPDLHTKIMVTAAKADQIAGQKLLVMYGTSTCAKYDSLYANSDRPFKTVLAEVLGSDYSIIKMPADVTPASAEGWIVANLDQIKLHYTVLPELKSQGINEEKMYSWHNFLSGSMMLEVLVANGIIRQPVTSYA